MWIFSTNDENRVEPGIVQQSIADSVYDPISNVILWENEWVDLVGRLKDY